MNKGVRQNLQAAVAKNERINLVLLNGGNLKGTAEALTYRMIKIQTEEESLWVPITEIESVSHTLQHNITGTPVDQEASREKDSQITISRIQEAIAQENNPIQLRALAELLITYLDKKIYD
ncbi:MULTISPECIES: hypothetical protein [unclassified Paenibacillus]|uniref:hypothetical protein n=1 Tax=unclassified Paenibacillus TaxID=185978 RepID=UPI003674155C